MKYNIIGYLIGEGFRNVFKNKKSTSASLIVMILTMLIFGIFFIIGENIDHMLTEVEKSQGIQVFLKTDATEEEIQKAGNEIRKIEGVNTVQFLSKEDALNTMKERLKDRPAILQGIEKEIFSVSYVVTFTDLSLSEAVQQQIEQLDNIKNITSREDTVNTLMNIGKWVRIFTGVLLIFLIIFSIFIISNTIKLTVHARRREISIMKYVGATNSFIRAPFIVEGIVIGLVSGIISILVIGMSYNVITEQVLQNESLQTANISLVGFSQMFTLIVIVYLVLGIGIGILGSSISMRKYLKV